jgi:HAE1 family hydrophobic/amphiphilic exporter-1
MPEHKKHDFNYYITRFFLNNGRLTFMLFLLLVVIGSVATFTLRTTGFPNPEVDALTIFTRYPGASSNSVLNQVSVPIENAIKDVEGVSGFESTSSNERSVVFLSIDLSSNVDTVKSEVDSAISALQLPSEADDPVISTPDISGPDFIFSVVSQDENLESLYLATQEFTENIEDLDQTASLEVINPIEPVVTIKPNLIEINRRGLDVQSLQAQLSTFGESLPVGSDITIDNASTSITTQLPERTVDDLKTFSISTFNPTNPESPVSFIELQDIAEITVEYEYSNNDPVYVGITTDQEDVVLPGVLINVKAVANTDQASYDADVTSANENLSIGAYFNPADVTFADLDQPLALRNYAVNDDNQEQVSEVVQGLFGGPLDVDNTIVAQIGWVLGALQLVFVTMFIFVSWRAAIISALAIPLSLGFTSIYLLLIGESFNTLVLFSLVLVIGLVVDPTLVVLEAIQRKIDSGKKGKDAVLAGIDDVGIGLFASTMTNVIVFLPFGLISGVIGQIFSYIPLTIIPAIIGSYIVALVFLSWIGGNLLSRTPNASDDEEENLWGIAKYLIHVNTSILHSRRIYRLIIILLTFGLSVGMMFVMFGGGFVEQTDFSTPSDSNFIIATRSFKSDVSVEDRLSTRASFAQDVLKYKGVMQVFPFGSQDSLLIQLEDRDESGRKTSTELAADLNDDLFEKYNNELFALNIGSSGPSGGVGSFPVQIGVYPESLDTSKDVSLAVAQTLRNVCNVDGGFEINETCDENNRVITQIDDGFTGQENRVINIQLNREELITSGIVNPAQIGTVPFALTGSIRTALVPQTNATIPNDTQAVTTVDLNNNETNVVIDLSDNVTNSIETAEALEEATILTGSGQTAVLEDIASIESTTPQDSIRRINGTTVLSIGGEVEEEFSDQGSIAQIQQTVFNYYQENDGERAQALGLEEDGVRAVELSAGPDFAQSFIELITTLLLAIVIIYTILTVFFKSFSKPLIILYTIPLAFIGLLPGLAFLGGGQLGFLEIIGLIILVGLVVNVALYLIDSARSYMLILGYNQKKAIATASGIRLRSVILTTITAIASLAPLAIYSEFYRSIAVVIMFGLATSGLTSLVTTPILYIFFNWLSDLYHKFNIWNKILFLAPLTIAIPVGVVTGLIEGFDSELLAPIVGITILVSIVVTLVYLIVFWFKTPREKMPHKTVKAPKRTQT